jgi:hypothetical protein
MASIEDYIEAALMEAHHLYSKGFKSGCLRDEIREWILSGKLILLFDDFYRLEKSDRLFVYKSLIKCPSVYFAVAAEYLDSANEVIDLKNRRDQAPLVIRQLKLRANEQMEFLRKNLSAKRDWSSCSSCDEISLVDKVKALTEIGFDFDCMTNLIAVLLSTREDSALSPVYYILKDDLKKAGLGVVNIPGNRIDFTNAEKFIYALGKFVNYQAKIGSSILGASETTRFIGLDSLLGFVSESGIRRHLKTLLFENDQRAVEFSSMAFYVFVGAFHRFYSPMEFAPTWFSRTFGGYWGDIQGLILRKSREIPMLKATFQKSLGTDAELKVRQRELEELMGSFRQSFDNTKMVTN